MYLTLSLFILLLSFNVCTSRILVELEETSSTKINISEKVSKSMEKEPLESNGETKTEDMKVNKNIGVVQVKHMKQEVSRHVPRKSGVSVSWLVPHRKEGKNPGFYSDYSRPRTRPPSHN
ncbi:root meristem growth factor 10-like [Vicia villosa]|uniref:root meristem growth factor 10-like n=1 Tax=Vicia villosa TaxID=3911 RepID=UPI00273C0ADF|nr:root meristem growth factor 10-like [Vicia villosa]